MVERSSLLVGKLGVFREIIVFGSMNETRQISHTRGELSPEELFFSLLYLKDSLASYGRRLILKWKES